MVRGRDSRGRVGSGFRALATLGIDAFGPAGARTSGVVDWATLGIDAFGPAGEGTSGVVDRSTGGVDAFGPAGARTSGVVAGAGLAVFSRGGGSTQTEPPRANTAGPEAPIPSSITARTSTRLLRRPRGRR